MADPADGAAPEGASGADSAAPPAGTPSTVSTIPLRQEPRPDPDQPSFGRYQILGELGKGAMGLVYKAHDPLIERTVAIKTINLSLECGDAAEYEARFYQEARAAGGLNHPNIVTIHDIGRSGNVAFMAMEFLEGREVRAMLAPGKPLPVEQAVSIAAQAAEGLASAHARGVIHRDVKPSNLMVGRDGLVKIMDFGIARMRSSDVLTQTGVVLGSPKYMSPEQVTGKRADHRSDLFSLGVVLYEMLTGRAPFEGENMTAIMLQTLNANPEPACTLNPEVPAVLDFIVAKMLAKKLDERYQEAREVAADLRECLKALQGQGAAQVSATRSLESIPETVARELAAEAPEGPPRSRRSDTEEDSPVTRGLSKQFDNLSATLRLAKFTGVGAEFGASTGTDGAPGPVDFHSYRLSETLEQPAMMAPSAPPPGLSLRDRLIYAAVLGATLVLAFLIVYF
ncbi:MAG TPA: serine/threonine-protein kinase [Burkholderiales bacterium]